MLKYISILFIIYTMTDTVNYGTGTFQKLEISDISAGVNSNFGPDPSDDVTNTGDLRIIVQNDGETQSTYMELSEKTKTLTFENTAEINNIKDSEGVKQSVNLAQYNAAILLPKPTSSSNTELAKSQTYMCKLQKPEDKPLEWTLGGNTNSNTAVVTFATSGILTFTDTSVRTGIAVYKPVLPQLTNAIYKEFELVTLGNNTGDGALGTILNVTVGLLTEAAYEATTNDANWAFTTLATNASSGGTFVLSFHHQDANPADTGFDVLQENNDETFKYINAGAVDIAITDWYKPGLRLQVGILYGGAGTSKLEVVFVYNGAIRSHGTVELGSGTDGLTDPLNSTQEDMYFFIGTGPGGNVAQQWRLSKKPLYKYFGTCHGNKVPYNLI